MKYDIRNQGKSNLLRAVSRRRNTAFKLWIKTNTRVKLNTSLDIKGNRRHQNTISVSMTAPPHV